MASTSCHESSRAPEGRVIVAKPRPGKKLLVIDLNMTLYDSTPGARCVGNRANRPFLHDFLKSVYENYDIIVWSAMPTKAVVDKLEDLGIVNHPADYQILYYLGRSRMTIASVCGTMKKIKQLNILWKKFPQYNETNTVMCDDKQYNFQLHPKNGILVKPYSHVEFETDLELIYLREYLRLISNEPDMSLVDHSIWNGSTRLH